MDNISDDDEDEDVEKNEQEKVEQKKKIDIGKRFIEELKSLVKLYSKLDVWLLFPLTFYTGFEVTFVWFEYSRVSLLKCFLNQILHYINIYSD
jgi:hypothetical protein